MLSGTKEESLPETADESDKPVTKKQLGKSKTKASSEGEGEAANTSQCSSPATPKRTAVNGK